MTYQDVVNKAAQRYPELKASATTSLALVQSAHTAILKAINLLPRASVTVTLTGAQQETLDSDVMEVSTADYQGASGSHKNLTPTSIDFLDNTNSGWRNSASSEPYCYYIDGNEIGFYPKPSATSGGYPVVVLWTRKKATIALTDTFPAWIPSDDAWVDTMRMDWAKDRAKDDVAELSKLARKSMLDLVNYVQSRSPVRPTVDLNVPLPRNP